MKSLKEKSKRNHRNAGVTDVLRENVNDGVRVVLSYGDALSACTDRSAERLPSSKNHRCIENSYMYLFIYLYI